MIQWVFQQQNRDSIVEKLNSLNTETLQELTTVAGISQINKVLDIWNSNQNNSSEEFWQNVLTEHSWIVSQIFAAPTIRYKEKSYVGGKYIDNKGGNIVDMLYRNKLSSNVVLIESKTPVTELIGKEYRHTYSMSNETSGAISQTLNYKHSIQQHYLGLQAGDRTSIFEAINPRTLLIIGNYNKELKGNQVKIEAFELYRQNLKDVQILTYDELFSKV